MTGRSHRLGIRYKDWVLTCTFRSALGCRDSSRRPLSPPTRLIVGRAAPAHQVSVHDPAIRPLGFFTNPLDVVDNFLELSGDQDLIGGADVGAPEDVDILVGKSLVTVLSIQHDNDAVDIVRKAFGDP